MIYNDNPVIAPPGVNPEHPALEPTPAKKIRQAKKSGTVENIQELGSTEIPTAKTNVHVMTIIGQIEGQPSITKTPKYRRCEYDQKTVNYQ